MGAQMLLSEVNDSVLLECPKPSILVMRRSKLKGCSFFEQSAAGFQHVPLQSFKFGAVTKQGHSDF